MNIAMIGSGSIAERHLATLVGGPDVRVIGHVARTRASSEAAADRWGGTAYDDVDALLTAARPDAAWVTVPPDAHEGIDERLVGAGVPFLVEKPLAADRATARSIGERVREAGLVVAVGYHWRAMDTLDEVRRALTRHPVRMALGAWHGLLPPPDWWRRQARSGGQMVEQATHLFDLARHLLGEAEVLHAVEGHRDRPETDVAGVSAATLRFSSGAIGVFTAANVLDHAHDVGLRLICDGLHVTVRQDGVTFESASERRFVRSLVDPIAEQNRTFLAAVRSGDPNGVHSPYLDALRTHHLTFDVHDRARPAEADPPTDRR